MMHKIQGRARVWRLVIGLAVLMCAQAEIVSADTFSDLSLSRLTEDYDQYRPNEILVRFADTAGLADMTGPYTPRAARTALVDRLLEGAVVRKNLDHVISGLALVQLPDAVSVLDAVRTFTKAEQVLYAEPNYRYNLNLMPSDPLFPDQWSFNNLGLGRGLLENADINAPEGWDIQVEAVIDDEPIIVAILDTGVDYNHPDLWPNMWVEQGIYVPEDVNLLEDPNNPIDPETDPNFWVFDYGIDVITGDISDTDPNDHLADGEPMDLHYHGTMVAGIIGAVHNNDEGMAGVCSVVSMLAVRVVDVNDNDGTTAAIDTAAVTTGLMGALGKGAKVINMSFSTPSYSQALYDAIAFANNQGVVVVASAGNSGVDADVLGAYPAAFDLENIISVMATDGQDQVASYSNYGLETVDLAAPGGDFLNDDGILTTTPQEENAAMAAVLPDPITTMYVRGDGSVPYGTSLAAPHVTGAVALAMAVNPALTPTQIRQIITHPLSVDLLPSLDGLCVSGGRLNLYKFLNACRPGDVYNVTKDAWYTSIPDAIKAASNGDEIVAQSDRSYWNPIDFSGKNILLRSGDLTDAPGSIGDPDPDRTFISAHFTDFDLQPTVTFKTNETANAILRGFTVSDGLRGIMVNGARPTIDDCVVSNNEGNGIYCQIGAGPTITNTRITNNASADVRFIVIGGFPIEVPADGAGVACMVMSSATITECEITNNKSAGSGGGVYCDDSSSAEINQSLVADNSALDGWGGGVCANGGSVKMEGTTLSNNYSEWEGGGLYVGVGSALVKNCSLLGNDANLDGGGMFCELGPQVFLWDTIFTGNRAQFSGGALGLRDTASMVEIKNCLVTNNVSDKDDGAGFAFLASSPTMTNCTFVGNDCTQYNLEGGAVFCRDASSPDIKNCIFNNNNDIAVVLYDAASQPSLDYCLFFENGQGDYGDIVTERARMSDPNTAHLVPGDHNINKDPMFVPGRMGPYYLSQSAAGQILSATGQVVDPNLNPEGATSPAVDTGSDTAENLGMTLTSTRTDNAVTGESKDTGRVDLGFHYDDPQPAVEYGLKTTTNPALATIKPDSPWVPLPFTQYSQVLVTVTVNDPARYRFKTWQGTDDDSQIALDENGKPAAVQQTVLTMDGDKDVVAVFETVTITLVVGVDGMSGDITPGEKIEVPRDEEVEITVDPHDNAAKVEWTDNSVPNGVPGVPIFSTMRTIKVKAEPPFKVNPRGDEYKIISARLYIPNTLEVRPTQSLDEVIAQAQDGDEVIVWPGTYPSLGRLSVIGKNITIRSRRPDDPEIVAQTVIGRSNPNGVLADSAFVFALNDPRTVLEGFTLRGFTNQAPDGVAGTVDAPNGGAGEDFMGGAIRCISSSPILRNLVIENCSVIGGSGGAGFNGDDTNPFGGQGGWPGVGAGGAIACLDFSDPTVTNCVFRNCLAAGGTGGNGGDAGPGGAPGNAGGYYTNPLADPFPNPAAINFSFIASSGGIGGAAYIDPTSSPIFKDCLFENCAASSSVTGVKGAGGEPGELTKPSVASGLDTAGGAVFVGGSRGLELILVDGELVEMLPVSKAQFLNCDFIGNFTSTPAAGTALKDALTGFGGAVAVSEGMEPSFRDCTFTVNSAPGGGAICSEEAGLVVEDCILAGNDGFQGGAAYLLGGTPQLLNNQFLSNRATRTIVSDPNDPNSIVLGTTGEGGAIFSFDSQALIQDCVLQNNDATLIGGAMEVTGGAPITLRNCLITENSAGHLGGGVSTSFYAQAEIRNCTIADNAVTGALFSPAFGGGLHLSYGAYAKVVDSIIWNNLAGPRDPSNTGDQIALYGGGVDPNYARLSTLEVLNSDIGPGVSVSGTAIYVDRGSVLLGWDAVNARWDPETGNISKNPLFTAGLIGEYYLSQPGAGQSETSPCVDTGSEGVADPNILLEGYTTSTDNHPDMGFVDMGYHFPILAFYRLVAEVIPVENPDNPGTTITPGEVDPNVAFVYQDIGNNVVTITAFPDEGWKVKRWIGTDNDGLTTQTNQVTVRGDKVVAVEFAKASKFHFAASVQPGANGVTHGTVQAMLQNRDGSFSPIDATGTDLYDGTTVHLVVVPDQGWKVDQWMGTDNDNLSSLKNTVFVTQDTLASVTMERRAVLTVPGDYATIQKAINAADDGDRIVLDPGTYYHGEDAVIMHINKSITVSSTNPEDPNVVAATVIDGLQNSGRQYAYMGVVFGPDADENTVLEGITIQNCGGEADDGNDGDRDVNEPDGQDGMFIWGAAILVRPGASPVIKNCVIQNNSATAGNGGNGENATDLENAGRGGWGGWARGGAVYCAYQSKPTFVNCQILGNVARGGNAGNGGNGVDPGGWPNYGGNYTPSLNMYIDSNSLALPTLVDQPLWQIWTNPRMTELSLAYELLLGELALQADPNLFSNLSFGSLVLDPAGLAGLTQLLVNFNPVGYLKDEYHYTALGGGVYCGEQSQVTFKGCEISGNRTYGGLAGISGTPADQDRAIEPLYTFEIPSFGGGVYCDRDAQVMFEGCTFADNMTSTGTDPIGGGTIDFTQRHDPYLGFGGGVCAEASANIEILDCNFVDNVADTGGGLYVTQSLVDVYDSNFISNNALRGAGIFGIRADATIGLCDFVANSAETDIDDTTDDSVETRGAGLAIDSSDAWIYDCNFVSNQAFGSGAGIYLQGQNETTVLNCLLQYNGAGRNGGGIAANMGATPSIRNCTFVHNLAGPTWLGGTDESGYGGALFAGNGSKCEVVDTIIWYNAARLGTAIATGQVLDYDERNCGAVEISYSDIMVGPNDVFDDCGTIVFGPEVFQRSTDPGFVKGPLGNFYLKDSSRAVDAGSTLASAYGLSSATTRADSEPDKGQVDMGYHYPMLEPCRICDLQRDGVIDIDDFNVLAQMVTQWRDIDCTGDDCWQDAPLVLEDISDLAQFELVWSEAECTEANNWCDGLDVNFDGYVDDGDVNQITWCWDVSDTRAPLPNPPEWESFGWGTGSAIQLKAKAVEDAWGWDVEYLFDNVTGEGHDSGWQASRSYTDRVGTDRAAYSYRFKTRDVITVDPDDERTWRFNESEWSDIVVVGSAADPGPAGPMETVVIGVTDTTITVSTSRLFDEDGVEYYIEAVSDDSTRNSGWIEDPNLAGNTAVGVTYTFTFLEPETEYELKFKARDGRGNQTHWSPVVRATTLALLNNIPPLPDPMIWSTVADANGFTGEPRAIQMDPLNPTFGWGVQMTAEIAVDDIGDPVQYFFDCLNNNDFDSGWIGTETYLVMTGNYPGRSTNIGGSLGLIFRVRARDASGNTTGWSVEEMTDEAAQAQAAAQQAQQGQQGQQGQVGGGAAIGGGAVP